MRFFKNSRKDGKIVTAELFEYLQNLSQDEPKSLQDLRAETLERVRQSHFMISAEQSQFLGFLIRLLRAKNCLDIGTFTGYSALLAALNIPPNGKVVTLDHKADLEPVRQSRVNLHQRLIHNRLRKNRLILLDRDVNRPLRFVLRELNHQLIS